MSSISLNLLLGIHLLKLWVSVQAEMELWKASGPEVRGPFWQASSNTNLILGPLSSLHVKQNWLIWWSDWPKPDCCIYFCCISLILIRMQEVRNLNSKSALPQPRSLLSVSENLAESSHRSEKRVLVWQICALTSALMQERCSGEISHEREASGGASEAVCRQILAPSVWEQLDPIRVLANMWMWGVG